MDIGEKSHFHLVQENTSYCITNSSFCSVFLAAHFIGGTRNQGTRECEQIAVFNGFISQVLYSFKRVIDLMPANYWVQSCWCKIMLCKLDSVSVICNLNALKAFCFPISGSGHPWGFSLPLGNLWEPLDGGGVGFYRTVPSARCSREIEGYWTYQVF